MVVRGELDLTNAGELKELLKGRLADGQTVFLDLSRTTFIDSTGLSAIVAAHQVASDAHADFLLYSELHPQARRLMELTGTLAQLRMVDGHAPSSLCQRV